MCKNNNYETNMKNVVRKIFVFITLNIMLFCNKALGPISKECVSIKSMGNVFGIDFIENSIQTGFPSIHIAACDMCNAWVQLVKTDSPFFDLQQFVDTCKDIAPFYTTKEFYEDFYDAPLWNITPTYRPLNYWIGHVYAVNVDFEAKTVTCLGGISWGFRIPEYKHTPTMIRPEGLTQQEWISDKQFFAKYLSDYIFK